MSYIRYGHPLYWFDDDSDLYVYGCCEGGIEDYGGSKHMPSVIEHIGRIIYRETGDLEYATLMILQLADNCGCFDKLRTSVPTLALYARDEYYQKYVDIIQKMLPIYQHRKEMWNDTSASV